MHEILRKNKLDSNVWQRFSSQILPCRSPSSWSLECCVLAGTLIVWSPRSQTQFLPSGSRCYFERIPCLAPAHSVLSLHNHARPATDSDFTTPYAFVGGCCSWFRRCCHSIEGSNNVITSPVVHHYCCCRGKTVRQRPWIDYIRTSRDFILHKNWLAETAS